ncbi:hypothetical protein SS50377_22392 [Spironucleus salmonicida]|uniref:Uncharacterized protein n=1 Tax=Spironucleus salmonicida TaxID=348837 RepID=V6LCY4_9EUKA|nr:hypothetical protein SS50377_22392 [Spironucleus salmonicida]|eukprot:EST42113.1 Hypothetical protein SS50377_18422 [Spironucleus salmonicida]
MKDLSQSLDFYRRGGIKQDNYNHNDIAKRFQKTVYDRSFTYTNKKALSPVKLKGANFFTHIKNGVVVNDLVQDKVDSINSEKDVAMLTCDSQELFFKLKREQYAFVATRQPKDYISSEFMISYAKSSRTKLNPVELSIHQIREHKQKWAKSQTIGSIKLPIFTDRIRSASFFLDTKLGASNYKQVGKNAFFETKYHIQ